MEYLWLKALHIAAVMTWIGGMLINSLAARALPAAAPRNAAEQRLVATARHWDRRVTSPALLLTWVLGITMAILAGWYASPWFMAKFLIAFFLSGLHGAQSSALRRMAANTNLAPPPFLRVSGVITLAAMLAVVALVITKPSIGL